MAKFETVPAIKMVFALLEPKADTKEEQEKLIDALTGIKEAVDKAVAEILPGIEVRWELPSPATAVIEDRGLPPKDRTISSEPEKPLETGLGRLAAGYL